MSAREDGFTANQLQGMSSGKAYENDELNPIQLAMLRVVTRWWKRSMVGYSVGLLFYLVSIAYLMVQGISLQSLNVWNGSAAGIVLVFTAIFFRAIWIEMNMETTSNLEEITSLV